MSDALGFLWLALGFGGSREILLHGIVMGSSNLFSHYSSTLLQCSNYLCLSRYSIYFMLIIVGVTMHILFGIKNVLNFREITYE